MDFNNTQNAFEAKSNGELKQASLLFKTMASPWLTAVGIQLTNMAFALHIPIRGLIKSTIYKQFCGGETLEEAHETAIKLNPFKVSVIMDYGVEGKSNEEEFEKTTDSFIHTISFAKDKSNIPFVSLKITAFARFVLLEKVHAGTDLTMEEKLEYERVVNRVNVFVPTPMNVVK